MQRILRCAFLVLLALMVSASAQEATPGLVRALECVPPSAVLIPPGVVGIDQPPVAVMETRVKPKRTRLYLDGRFIGLADDFDSTPDYLYLRPGSYRLRAELEGYAPAYFDVTAGEGCLFELRHAMVRIPGTARDPWWGRKARPFPFLRQYGPLRQPEARPETVVHRGADLRLRPNVVDRAPTAARDDEGPSALGAGQLSLAVEPASATVLLDGEFWIEARELARLASPIALPAGVYTLEIAAPGFVTETLSLTVPEKELLKVQVSLDPVTEAP